MIQDNIDEISEIKYNKWLIIVKRKQLQKRQKK
jgi:hypothetical protein